MPPYQSLVELLEAGALSGGGLGSELAEVVSGRRAGRVEPDEVIVCLNPAFGVIDAAVARFVYDRARALGIGTELSP